MTSEHEGLESLYARFECVKQHAPEGYKLLSERLEDHLVDVAVAAYVLAERLGGDARAAALAAALHDVGKVLHNLVWRDSVRRVEHGGCRGEWRLSFRHHEVLSAAIYGCYAWLEEQGGGIDDRVVTRAILLHHQGLRGLETRVYVDGLAWVANMLARMREERQLVERSITRVLESVADRLERCETRSSMLRECCSVHKDGFGGVAERLKRVADFVESIGLEPILENATTMLGEWIRVPPEREHSRRARIVSGVLMVADNAVVLEHVGEEAEQRLYPREARWLEERTIILRCGGYTPAKP